MNNGYSYEENEKKNIEKSLLLIVLIIASFFFLKGFLFSEDNINAFDIALTVGDNYYLDDEEGLIWSSSDDNIALVDEDGKVTGISTGSVTIVAERDGKIIYEYTITIKDEDSLDKGNVEVNSIDFTVNSISLLVGDTYKPTLSIDPDSYDRSKLIWNSSDDSVVSIKDGIITAIGEGSVTVTVATSNGLSSTCKVTVEENSTLESIKFSDGSKSIYVGEKYQSEIIFNPSSMKTKVAYKSSNEKVATVSSDGLIVGKSEGKVVITASVNGLSTNINITVSKSNDKTINVKFDSNGASKIGSNSDKCTSSGSGCTIKLPSITRSGYSIVGWSTNANATSAEYKVGEKITVYGDTTYYAITYKTLKADFKANGASIDDTTKTCKVYNKNDSCSVNTPNIVRSGYSIIGWGTSANATSKSVSSNRDITLKSDVTYYAITSRELTANFVSNGASGSDIKKECTIYNTTSSCEVIAPSITRSGYTIVGWGSSANATSKVLDSGSSIKLSKDITYYAVTYKNVTAKFEANRSNISKTSASCKIYNTSSSCSVTSPTISRSNYSVIGWGKSEDASSSVTKSGGNISLSSSTTYYAITKINTDGIEAGCTGWMAASTYYYASASTSSSKSRISVGTTFTIEGVEGNFFKVSIPSVSGYKYVEHKYVMINLADYIPSMVFEIANASSSIYKSSGYSLPNVTGTQLYASGKVYNVRLRKNEYMAPMLYSAAKKLLVAQRKFLAQGYSIKAYDTYRPHSVTVKIYNSLNGLYDSNSTVKNNILYSYGASGTRYTWGKGWFLAAGVSTHNTGSAIDMTLVYKSSGQEVTMPTVMHELSTKAIKYYSPSVSKVPANYSKEMNDAAKLMDSVVTSAGLTPLASEWWHFQDSDANNLIKSVESNGCDFSVTKVYSY